MAFEQLMAESMKKQEKKKDEQKDKHHHFGKHAEHTDPSSHGKFGSKGSPHSS